MTGGSPSAERIAAWASREPVVDAGGMRRLVAAFPDHLAEGAGRAAAFAAGLPVPEPPPRALVVAGMGGSAIGADLAAAGWSDRRSVPLVTVRDYVLPGWVDRRDVVIASSYSGETAETLAAFGEAKERGSRVVALTTGGRLAALAEEAGDPVLVLPGGFPPRAALGHSLAACSLVVARLDPGLEVGAERDRLERAAAAIGPRAAEWLEWSPENPALRLAASFEGRLPVVYGGHPVAVAAARRWKTQLNENAKTPAFAGEFPERDHNDVVGLEGAEEVRGRLCLVFLETPWDLPAVRRRIELAHRDAEERVAARHRVMAEGEEPVSGMVWLCHLGDCASFLASVIAERDPTPVTSIDRLKAALGAAGTGRSDGEASTP